MMIWERPNQFLSKIPEMSNRLRLKANQILIKLPSMLKLNYMLTPVSSHLMPTKLTQLIFFPMKLNGKIGMTCLIRYVVKQIGGIFNCCTKIQFDQSNVATSM